MKLLVAILPMLLALPAVAQPIIIPLEPQRPAEPPPPPPSPVPVAPPQAEASPASTAPAKAAPADDPAQARPPAR